MQPMPHGNSVSHAVIVFSERELFTFAICCRPFVCRLLSVTFVHRSQSVEIFSNVSTSFGTLAIR